MKNNITENEIIKEKEELESGLQEIISKAIASKKANIIYIVADLIADLGEEAESLVDALIETGNAKYMCIYASQIKGAPVMKLAKEVVETKNYRYFTEFALSVKGAPIGYLADAMCMYGTAQEIYEFALNVKKAPKDKLARAMIRVGNESDIEAYAYDVMHMSTEDFVEKFGQTYEREI